MNMSENEQLSVPPGFRFHPTDEELLYYYLRKKVSYEAIDLDVIREIDLNKIEPWDLKDKCRIASGPQNDWYFFSHKDKKYPTGTRTNRATSAGFWKATGRDKAIYMSNSKRIGMRKTLVFYTGRAPHGNKTDWIMHEYRLEDDNSNQLQEEGWVVCRVSKKKTHTRGFLPEVDEEGILNINTKLASSSTSILQLEPKQNHHMQPVLYNYNSTFDGSLHLPQLFSPESALNVGLNTTNNIECSSHNLLSLNGCGNNGGVHINPPQRMMNNDFSFLDKLLASNNQNQMDHHHHNHHQSKLMDPTSVDYQLHVGSSSSQKMFHFQYLGCDMDVMKYSKH
ncbi:hypothetical protein ACFE04_024952 [Oxalis oulophora]